MISLIPSTHSLSAHHQVLSILLTNYILNPPSFPFYGHYSVAQNTVIYHLNLTGLLICCSLSWVESLITKLGLIEPSPQPDTAATQFPVLALPTLCMTLQKSRPSLSLYCLVYKAEINLLFTLPTFQASGVNMCCKPQVLPKWEGLQTPEL